MALSGSHPTLSRTSSLGAYTLHSKFTWTKKKHMRHTYRHTQVHYNGHYRHRVIERQHSTGIHKKDQKKTRYSTGYRAPISKCGVPSCEETLIPASLASVLRGYGFRSARRDSEGQRRSRFRTCNEWHGIIIHKREKGHRVKYNARNASVLWVCMSPSRCRVLCPSQYNTIQPPKF